MGKTTEPLKTRQYVTTETLTADRSPLDFGDVGHAEIVRNMDFS